MNVSLASNKQASLVATVVVVPCFNEAARLDLVAMSAGIASREWCVYFVDDGSTDETTGLLEGLRDADHGRVSILQMPHNVGKGEAVRRGMLAGLADGAEFVAYFDADLSTPFNELGRLVDRIRREPECDVVLGSRVLRLGSDIQRSRLRHYLGRVYATMASFVLGVGVYDTQCGAKVFRATPRLTAVLQEPFSERWAFDVELLSRLTDQRDPTWASMVEEPLLVWHDRPGSKLTPFAALRAAIGLARIGYRRRTGP